MLLRDTNRNTWSKKYNKKLKYINFKLKLTLWRNLEEHDTEYSRPHEPLLHILKRREDYDNALKLYHNVRGVENVAACLGWKPPVLSMFKLNRMAQAKRIIRQGVEELSKTLKGDGKEA